MNLGIALVCVVCVPGTPDSVINSPAVLLDETQLGEGDLEDLAWLLAHPVDLNRVTEAELTRCCLISAAEAADILALRRSLGGFSRLADLHILGPDLVGRLEPYVVVGTRSSQRARSRSEPFLEMRLRMAQAGDRAGENRSAWLGSAWREYGRVIIRPHPSVEFAALAEKDPGERWRDGFVSGYASLRNAGPLSFLTIGDYVVESGEGLLLGRKSILSSFRMTSAGSRAQFVRPSRYTDESEFFRGVAATLTFPLSRRGSGIELSGFLSRRERDAAAGYGTTAGALYDEGLFRTASEIARRGVVREDAAGFRLQVAVDEGATLGVSGYASTFSRPVPADARPGVASLGAGSLSASAVFRFGGLMLAGEIARSGATLALTMRSRPHAEFTSGVRVCGLRRVVLHARSPAPEAALFAHWKVSPLGWLRVLGSVDQSRSLREVRTTGSSRQNAGIMLQADMALTGDTDLSLRWMRRVSETLVAVHDSSMRDVRMAVPRSAEALRCVATVDVTSSLTLRVRWEKNRVTYPLPGRGSAGCLLSQSLSLGLTDGLALSASIAFFDADSYESSAYQLEEDVRGAFSMPPLYGQGRRWYVCAVWRCTDAVTLSAKHASSDIAWRQDMRGPRHETSLTAQLDVRL